MQVPGLILDSLGSTELLFILVIALIFFGPRRLPQLSRTIGKSLAEFRKASEDFKRTWEREVALESTRVPDGTDNASLNDERSVTDSHASILREPSVAPIPAEHVMARGPGLSTSIDSHGEMNSSDTGTEPGQSESLPKHEWL